MNFFKRAIKYIRLKWAIISLDGEAMVSYDRLMGFASGMSASIKEAQDAQEKNAIVREELAKEMDEASEKLIRAMRVPNIVPDDNVIFDENGSPIYLAVKPPRQGVPDIDTTGMTFEEIGKAIDIEHHSIAALGTYNGKMYTQKQRVFLQLTNLGYVTTNDAKVMGIKCLSARICELRQDGIDIMTQPEDGYTSYQLV